MLLSGADYPIKRSAQLELFLEEEPFKEFISHTPVISDWPKARFRYAYAYTDYKWANRKLARLGRILNGIVPAIKPPDGITMYGGSQWWCITRTAAEICLEFYRSDSQILKLFRRMTLPDEHFFQTVILNSCLRNNVVNRNLHKIDFSGAHPRIFRSHDLSDLLQSDSFFARKFDTSVDSQILDELDESMKIADCEPLPKKSLCI